jgi:hypothetical protein
MRFLKLVGVVIFFVILFFPQVSWAVACDMDAHCPKGQVCSMAGSCVFSCKVDTDCQKGQECYKNQCVRSSTGSTTYEKRACASDSDCESGTKCLENVCVLDVIAENNKDEQDDTGIGNVTCGGRTFQCAPGGFFADVSSACYCCGQCTPNDLLVVGNTFLKWLFGIVGAIGLVMFVWGGFNWVTSFGDRGKVEAGKKAITNTLIGLLIMFSAGVVVVTIQEKLGLDVKVTVVGQLDSSAGTDASGSGGDGQTIHGNLQLGDKCTVQEKTSNTDCAEGMSCYAVKDNPETKGVCLLKNPKGSSKPGYRCWILNDGSNTCALGVCKVTVAKPLSGTDWILEEGNPCPDGDCSVVVEKPLPGTEGVCTGEDEVSKIVGKACKTDTECGTGFKCTNKKCVIVAGSGMDRRETCYILPGSKSNDCKSGLKCFPDVNNVKATRTVGAKGICAYNQSLVEGKICIGNVECKTGLLCKRIPKAATEICVSSTRKFDVELGKSCFRVTMEGGSSNPEDQFKNVIDNCVLGASCYYGKDSDKSGVCAPPNPVNSVSSMSGECYILPGSASMCANDLQCVSYISKTYKTTPGSKGICIPKYNSVDVGQTCVYLPGTKTVCKSGLTCDMGMWPKDFGRQGTCVRK